jgi:hypothetical protein
MKTKWPSIDESEPSEEGGPVARSGFNYQDEIAVGFLIEMLEDPELLKVHCETHDDVVLIRKGPSATAVAEYVQVKASEQDKLWSVPDICQRKKAKKWSSIVEKSLERDKHAEASFFRVVTLRPVVSELKPLTSAVAALSRKTNEQQMKALCADLETRLPGIKSAKGNGLCFWLRMCFWDQRHSEKAVIQDNLLRLLRLGHKEKSPILPDQAEVLLLELRAKAKAAGDAKWKTDREKKILSRVDLRAWWETRLKELTVGAATKSGGKLSTKMVDAGLPEELIALAVELRLGYSAEMRAPRYLDVSEIDRLQRQVQSEVVSLRARFIAGQLNMDAATFHALCLDRMDSINGERPPGNEDRSAFLKGCMYDIADRCLLKFAGQSS